MALLPPKSSFSSTSTASKLPGKKSVDEGSNRIRPGSVVEYEQHGKPILATVLADRRGKWAIRNEAQEELELASERLYLFPGNAPTDLLSLITQAQEISDRIELQDLWEELVQSPREYFIPELTLKLLGENSQVNHLALRRKFLADTVFFKRSKFGFEPRASDAVAALRVKADAEAGKKHQRDLLIRALVARIKDPNKQTEPLPDSIYALEQLAALGGKAEDAKGSTTVLDEVAKAAGLPTTGKLDERAYIMLVRAGHFSPDENMTIHRIRRPVRFSQAILKESEVLKANYSAIINERTNDLTKLRTFTIDSDTTRDMDDALSIERTSQGFRLGIHISDVAAVILPGSQLEAEGFSRGTSIYCPDSQIPMLPTPLSEGVLSLTANEERLAMSFLVEMDSEYQITNRQALLSKIRVQRKLNYEEVDAILYGEPDARLDSIPAEIKTDLLLLWEAASGQELRRLQAGAVQFSRRELNAKLSESGEIQLEETLEDTPGHKLVSELMVLANETAALFAVEKNISLVFRGQERPEVNPEEFALDVPEGPARDFARRGLLKRSVLGSRPMQHYGLGLRGYAQVTSPIRRVLDLVNQRQISTFLTTGKPHYSPAQIQQLIELTEAPLDEAQFIQRDRNRYFLLRYLEQEKVSELDGMVMRIEGHKPLAELDILFTVVPFNAGAKGSPAERAGLHLGDKIRLHIEELNPRKDILILKRI